MVTAVHYTPVCVFDPFYYITWRQDLPSYPFIYSNAYTDEMLENREGAIKRTIQRNSQHRVYKTKKNKRKEKYKKARKWAVMYMCVLGALASLFTMFLWIPGTVRYFRFVILSSLSVFTPKRFQQEMSITSLFLNIQCIG